MDMITVDERGEVPPRSRPRTVLFRGLIRRCGVCGGGKLFYRWFTMHERCGRCNLRLAREYGSALGGMTINMLFCYAAAFAVGGAWLGIYGLDFPVGPALVSSVGATFVAGTLGYPFSKTVWLSISLLMDPPVAREFTTRISQTESVRSDTART